MRFHKYKRSETITSSSTPLTARPDDRAGAPHLRSQFGVGSDGSCWERQDPTVSPRILNPDGSEAEKSGNGLRIYARYLGPGVVRNEPFPVMTKAPACSARCRRRAGSCSWRWGGPRSTACACPWADRARGGGRADHGRERDDEVTAVGVGNPHCVVHVDDATT